MILVEDHVDVSENQRVANYTGQIWLRLAE